MLYATDEGIVLKSAEGFVETIAGIVTEFEAAGFTVSEINTQTMLVRTRDHTPTAPSLVIEALA